MNKICTRVLGMAESVSLARVLLTILSVVFIGYALAIIALRINCPVQFDVFEGKELCKAYDFANGADIYRDPSVGGATDIYTPFYPMLLSRILLVVPPSFFWGRLLSMLASGLTCLIFVRWLWARPSGDRPMILLLVAMFLSVAWRTNWFVCALKPDSLCHLFWLGAFAVALYAGRWAATGSALLLVAAFYTKQTAVFAIPGLLVFFFLRGWRDGLVFSMVLGLGMMIMFPVLKLLTGSWMAFYVFGRMSVNAGGGFPVSSLAGHFFSLSALPLLLVSSIVGIVLVRAKWDDPGYRLALLSLPCLVGGSVLTTSSVGGNLNSMMPACYGMLFLGSYAIAWGFERWRGQAGYAWAVLFLLGMQFDALFPYHASKGLGRLDKDFVEVVTFLKGAEGSMYAPSHNVLTLLAGHAENDDRTLAWFISNRTGAGLDRIRAKVNSCTFDWLILTGFTHDIADLTQDTLARYETAREFGEWTILHKRPQ